MEDRSRERYDWIWRQMPLQKPNIWASWEICKDFVGKRCLEIGCGNYPRIPLEGGSFLDLSETAVNNLKAKGLRAYLGTAEKLPFKDNSFDLVVAWDVMEHIPDDRRAFAEVTRVLKSGGHFLFSVPLREEYFGPWDIAVEHLRRYEVAELDEILERSGFQVIKFQGQNALKHIQRIPFLVQLFAKLVNPPLRNYQFSLPVPLRLRAFLIRGYARLGRVLAAPWKTGRLADVGGEANITIFCRKK